MESERGLAETDREDGQTDRQTDGGEMDEIVGVVGGGWMFVRESNQTAKKTKI